MEYNRTKGIPSRVICFALIFTRVMSIIRYIGVDFQFGLLHLVRYNGVSLYRGLVPYTLL